MMKSLFLSIICVLALTGTASAQNGLNSSPRAQACMKKYGFTYAEWRAYSVPAEKAEPYRRCRDGGRRS